MAAYDTEAILLAVRDWRGADRLVTFFSRDQGKVTALARGAKRPRSPLAGTVQAFNHVRLLLYSGRNHIDVINQCEVLHSFRALQEDLDKMTYGACMAELAVELLPERQAEQQVFALLAEAFNAAEKHNSRLVFLSFALKIFILAGFRPELDQCVGCHGMVASPAYFSCSGGGVMCRACHRGTDLMLAAPVLACLKKLAALDLKLPGKFSLPAAAVNDAEDIITAYARCIVDRPLKAQAFLAAVRHNVSQAGHANEKNRGMTRGQHDHVGKD